MDPWLWIEETAFAVASYGKQLGAGLTEKLLPWLGRDGQ
jgi:hypothetical protein